MADDNSYKLGDKDYQDDKKQKSRNEADLLKQAMESKYTRLLSENFLIGMNDIMDTATMVGLQKNVYPLYDELKELTRAKWCQRPLVLCLPAKKKPILNVM